MMRILHGTFHILTLVTAGIGLAGCVGGDDRASSPHSTEISVALQGLVDDADTLLMTDSHAFSTDPETHRIDRNRGIFQSIRADCQGSVCHDVLPDELNVPVRISGITVEDTYTFRGRDRGIPFVTGRSVEVRDRQTFESFSYGGWLDHNAFFVSGTNIYTGEQIQSDNAVVSLLGAISIGNDTGSRPVAGSARWTGGMVGVESLRRHTVQGDATLAVDFDAAELSVAFTDVRNSDTGESLPTMRWSGLDIEDDGVFAARRDSLGQTTLTGTFYGPDHAEVGGVFERDEIAGAFGARRQE